MVACPSCGSELGSDVKFCRSCGAAMPSGKPGAETGPLCMSCGQVLSKTAKFCNQCGIPVRRDPNAAGSQSGSMDIGSAGSVCPACNSTLPPSAKFCRSCGKPVIPKPDIPEFVAPFVMPDETVLGTIPARHRIGFLKDTSHSTMVVTSRRMIFIQAAHTADVGTQGQSPAVSPWPGRNFSVNNSDITSLRLMLKPESDHNVFVMTVIAPGINNSVELDETRQTYDLLRNTYGEKLQVPAGYSPPPEVPSRN